MRVRRSGRSFLPAWARALPLFLFALLLAFPFGSAEAQVKTEDETPAKKVYVGLFLRDVSKFEQAEGVFDVDFDFWCKWLGKFDPEKLLLANAATVEQSKLSEEADGAWHSARFRVRGTLRGEFSVKDYPFDVQTLPVVFELKEADGVLAPDLAGSGIAPRFSITGWLYEPKFRPRESSVNYNSDLGSILTEGKAAITHRASFEVEVRRPRINSALKLFLPLGIILMVAIIALFLHPEDLEARAGIGVTALLSCFAFQFTVASSIPEVSYLTFSDSLFVNTYAVTALALITTIRSGRLVRTGRKDAALRLDQGARFLLVAAAVLVPILFWPQRIDPPRRPDPIPASPRHTSSRDLLRIGTSLPFTQLSAAFGATRAITSSLTLRRDDSTLPLYVEEVPSISNGSLQFETGGLLSVQWRLREGVKWSDGSPLRARDLVLGLERSKRETLEVAKPLDERSVLAIYKERAHEALSGAEPLPVSEFEKLGPDAGIAQLLEARRSGVSLSLGPYRVVSFDPKKRLKLEANPFYIGAQPNIAHIEITYFENRKDLRASFERGELDLVATNSLSPEDTEAVQKARPEAVFVLPGNYLYYFAYDPEHPLFKTKESRHLFVGAIDRKALVDRFYKGVGRVATTPALATTAGAPETPYRPDLARAGYQSLPEEARRLTLYCNPNDTQDCLIAEAIADQLRKVSLIVEVRPGKTADLRKAGGFRGVVSALTSAVEKGDVGLKLWSLPLKEGRFDTSVRTSTFDDSVADLYERYRHALYDERRDDLRERLLRTYMDRLPTLPLLFISERRIFDPKLKGTEAEPGALGDHIDEWYFDP